MPNQNALWNVALALVLGAVLVTVLRAMLLA